MVSGPRIYLAMVWLYLAGIVVQTFGMKAWRLVTSSDSASAQGA